MALVEAKEAIVLCQEASLENNPLELVSCSDALVEKAQTFMHSNVSIVIPTSKKTDYISTKTLLAGILRMPVAASNGGL